LGLFLCPRLCKNFRGYAPLDCKNLCKNCKMGALER
jgi:hypothetical protein